MSSVVSALRLLALAIGLVVAALAPAAATSKAEPIAGPPEPYKLMRTLQGLQEQIARGNVSAHNAQRSMITHLSEQFLAADPSLWQSQRNAHAAVAFVLGGGPPQVLRRLMRLDPAPAADQTLMRGALAYVEGREAEALEALGSFDPLALPGHLGAQLAIVQSALAVRDDQDKAVRLLAIARLLAPGTLIEEAALRREIFVEGQRGNIVRFEFLSIQYLRRFRNSVYAGNFRQRFVVLLSQLDFAEDVDSFMRLEAILAQMDGEGKRDLYLFFARHSLLNGRIDLARLASDRASALSAGGSAEDARAQLYNAAAAIATTDFDDAVERLLALDQGKLPTADRLLLEAAMDLAIQVGDAVLAEDEVLAGAADAEARGPAGEDIAAQALAAVSYEPTPVMQRAQAALAEIDQLLEGKIR
jgi:chemotaxis protein MotC